MSDNNIYPIFSRMQIRNDKEGLLGQHSIMIWLTGLSGSGKSTIAIALEKELFRLGFLCRILDGDNIRSGINNNLGFTQEDRIENIRRIAEIGKLFIDSGIITISAFISPNNEVRNLARSIIGEKDFVEVFISTPLEVCEGRDVKGLYKKARRGEIQHFTGISAPFERPENPAIEIDTTAMSVEESVKKIMDVILPLISTKKDVEWGF
ncbi:MAG: adenylyl-sulfate kinase [Rikenellaceae bacterium]|nr:adenylyl-sulfate kinase [Rikenellaceae bacterium]